MPKPIIINTWTLLFPRRKIDMEKGGIWSNALRTYPSRKRAEIEATCFDMFDKTGGKWPRPAKVKITVQP